MTRAVGLCWAFGAVTIRGWNPRPIHGDDDWFGFGPDDDEDVVAGDDAADLGCPDPEDLHDPAEVVPPAALLLAADPTQLPASRSITG